jgi:putative MATE family efflux protein
LRKKIFSIALPAMIQNLMQYFQLQVDMAFLGHYNTLLLSAVSNVIFPYSVLYSTLISISTGVTILVAHNIGAQKYPEAKRHSEVSFVYNSILSNVLFFTIFIFAGSILQWMGTSPEIHVYAVQFMKILSLSLIFAGIELSISSTLLGMGITKYIMYAGILRNLLNMVLDWVLIYGKLGMPEMGIKGAALATTLSNFAACLFFILVIVFKKQLFIRISLKGILQPSWLIQKKNIWIGFPTGLESILWTLGQTVVIRMINEVDILSAGIYLLVARIQIIAFFVYFGIAQATMTLVGQKMGAGKPAEAIRVGLLSLKYSFVVCAGTAFIFIVFPHQILSIFTYDKEIINKSVILMYVVSFTVFPQAVNVVIGSAIRGMKDTRWMLYTQIFGTLFKIAAAAFSIFVLHLGLLGLFLTGLLDETIRGGMNFIRFYRGKAFYRRLFSLHRL